MNIHDKEIIDEMVEVSERMEHHINLHGITKEMFLSRDGYSEMLLMSVMRIGELANHLSDKCMEDMSDIPWHEIRGFRNIIAHDYGKIRMEWAWDTVAESVPDLLIELKCYLDCGLIFDDVTKNCIDDAKAKAASINESREHQPKPRGKGYGEPEV